MYIERVLVFLRTAADSRLLREEVGVEKGISNEVVLRADP